MPAARSPAPAVSCARALPHGGVPSGFKRANGKAQRANEKGASNVAVGCINRARTSASWTRDSSSARSLASPASSSAACFSSAAFVCHKPKPRVSSSKSANLAQRRGARTTGRNAQSTRASPPTQPPCRRGGAEPLAGGTGGALEHAEVVGRGVHRSVTRSPPWLAPAEAHLQTRCRLFTSLCVLLAQA